MKPELKDNLTGRNKLASVRGAAPHQYGSDNSNHQVRVGAHQPSLQLNTVAKSTVLVRGTLHEVFIGCPTCQPPIAPTRIVP